MENYNFDTDTHNEPAKAEGLTNSHPTDKQVESKPEVEEGRSDLYPKPTAPEAPKEEQQVRKRLNRYSRYLLNLVKTWVKF